MVLDELIKGTTNKYTIRHTVSPSGGEGTNQKQDPSNEKSKEPSNKLIVVNGFTTRPVAAVPASIKCLSAATKSLNNPHVPPLPIQSAVRSRGPGLP